MKIFFLLKITTKVNKEKQNNILPYVARYCGPSPTTRFYNVSKNNRYG